MHRLVLEIISECFAPPMGAYYGLMVSSLTDWHGRRVAIVSPHRDDAAFSCGLLIDLCLRQSIDVTIVNVFTESGYAPYLPTDSLAAITRARAKEDLAFLQLLRSRGGQVEMREIGWSDAPLRLAVEAEEVLHQPLSADAYEREVERLAEQFAELRRFDLVMLPLGIGGHVDHCIARDAGRRALQPVCAGFYEDLPYASRATQREREASVERLGPSKEGRLEAVVVRHDSGAELKRTFAALYPSQIAEEVMEEIAAHAREMGEGERHFLPEAIAGSLTTPDVLREAEGVNAV